MKQSDDWRPGPETPRAHRFEVAFCDDPTCGLHIVPYDAAGKPICEIVMSADQTLRVIEVCQEHLYDKATRRP
jgi:hypothetical protein